MNAVRVKLLGWKTYLAAYTTISGVWVGFFNGVVSLEAAITATVTAVIGLTIGAKIDRAAAK